MDPAYLESGLRAGLTGYWEEVAEQQLVTGIWISIGYRVSHNQL